jgi:hypothetical protein
MTVSKRLFALTMNMIIILHLARTVKAYLWCYQHVPPRINLTCPQRRSKLHKYGHYDRSVVTKREVFCIPVYRYIDDNKCGKSRLAFAMSVPSMVCHRQCQLRFYRELNWLMTDT